jgi:hypothetical protein
MQEDNDMLTLRQLCCGKKKGLLGNTALEWIIERLQLVLQFSQTG